MLVEVLAIGVSKSLGGGTKAGILLCLNEQVM